VLKKMTVYAQEEVRKALKELEAQKSIGTSGNGWKLSVEPKYGLTTWVKRFPRFIFHEDRGGLRGLSDLEGHLDVQFQDLNDQRLEGWLC
jgi:hypothetical protein